MSSSRPSHPEPTFACADAMTVSAHHVALGCLTHEGLHWPTIVDEGGNAVLLGTPYVIPIETAGPFAPPAVCAPKRQLE